MKHAFLETPSWVRNNFSSFEHSLNGGAKSSAHKMRQHAFQDLLARGLPSTKNEDWKYTNIAPLLRSAFSLASESSLVTPDKKVLAPYQLAGLDAIRIVFSDGIFLPEFSDELPEGALTVRRLRDCLESDDSEVISQIGKCESMDESPFVALNTSFVSDGLVVTVSEGVQAPKPILLTFVSGQSNERVIAHPRIVVVAEKQSSVEIIEQFVGLGDSEYFANPVAEFLVGEQAHVTHSRLVLETKHSCHVSALHAELAEQSRFDTFCFSFDGGLVRNDIRVRIAGENSEAGLYGLSIGRDSQHIDNHTLIEHAVPNCLSNEWYKGIYNDQSRGVFNGTIVVHEGAQKTNAIQSNQGLLLSDRAGLDTRPQLKIWADDVRCTHGATIGQLDEDAMYYLRTRGIGVEEAKRMLIQAFAEDIVEKIPQTILRESLEAMLLDRLG